MTESTNLSEAMMAALKFKSPIVRSGRWWTHKGSNLGPLPCEGNALPLSYASGIRRRRAVYLSTILSENRYLLFRIMLASEPAIYEVRAHSVKRSKRSNRGYWKRFSGESGPPSRPLLAGAGGVRLQGPDPLGQRAAAFGRGRGGHGVVGRLGR